MRFGAVFPTTEIGSDPGAIGAFAQGIESLGFDHVVTYDHVLGAPHDGRHRPLSGPYDEHDEFHEPFVLFGHLAALTKHLELVVGVLVAPQRQTALIAKQAVEVQLLSNGRLRLALGTGWNWVEYDALGLDFDSRGPRLDEQVELLRRLWSEPLVSHAGRFETIDRAGILPLPDVQIPIWFGGYADVALSRTARHGVGHLFGHLRPETFDQLERLHSFAADAGRRVAAEAIVDVSLDAAVEAPARWKAAGGTHIAARTMVTTEALGSRCDGVDEHLAALARWSDAVGPLDSRGSS